MNYSTYLFDFDYTLVNSELGIVNCFIKTLQDYNIHEISDYNIKRTIGLPLIDAFAKLINSNDEVLLSNLKKTYIGYEQDLVVSNTFLFPETEKTLYTLYSNHKKIGIISNKPRKLIECTLEKYSISNLISIVIGSEDVNKAKPNPEGLNLALSLLNTSKNTTLYVGDSLIDYHTAQNANVNFVGITTGTTTSDDFNSVKAKNISSLLQLL